MKVAIHQPNFMPWLGIFHRLAMVDRFVVFDHVQAMGGRSWLSRNRLLINGQARWFSLPVRKSGRLGQTVREVEISYEGDVVRKHLRTLELSYGRYPYADLFLQMMRGLYGAEYRHIAQFNMAFIQAVCAHLKITPEFVRSSDMILEDPSIAVLKGNDLVVAVCQAAGATEYISGEGCLDFIKPEVFAEQGIEFYFQNFEHPAYFQRGAKTFIPYLSVFDALCNLGSAATRELIAVPARERPLPESMRTVENGR